MRGRAQVSRGAGELVECPRIGPDAVTHHAATHEPGRAVHAAAGSSIWRTRSPARSSRGCGCRGVPTATAALAIRAPAAWIRDRRSGRAWLVAEPGFEALLERFARRCEQRWHRSRSGACGAVSRSRRRIRARFSSAVRRALEYIAAGDVYQANLSRRWRGRVGGGELDPVALYRAAARRQPQPFAALLRDGGVRGDQLLARAAGIGARRHGVDAADRRHAAARCHRPSAMRR